MIEKIIQKVFDSDEIKNFINSIDDAQKRGDLLTRIVSYCIIMDSNEEMETFMNLENNAQVDFVRKQIAKKLNIEDTKENEHEIFKYACEKLLTNGYVYHVTNSVAKEKIMKTGLSASKGIKDDEQLINIANIFEKYGKISSIGWAGLDLENNKGWCYDGTLLNIVHYSNSPEWFAQLCGESIQYGYGLLQEQERHAFRNRNYNQALNNIKTLIDKIGMSGKEKVEILDFFNKNWQIYESSTPELLLIPRKDVGLAEDAEGVAKIFTISYLNDLLSGRVFFVNDKDSKVEISPNHIKAIDILKMFGPKSSIKTNLKDTQSNISGNIPVKNEESTAKKQQEKSIAEYIEDSLKMKNIQHKCLRTNIMNMSEQEKASNCLGQVINYCILFKNNEGIDEYMSLKDNEVRKQYIKNKIAKILSIDITQIEKHQTEIANFLLEHFEKNGFAFHTTNSLCAEEILKNGISKNKRPWTKDEIWEIDEIFCKYGKSNVMGWATADLKNGDGWFYDLTPRNIEDYAGAPEWFAQFCGEAIYGYNFIEEQNRSAFRHRNYEVAEGNIKKLIGSLDMQQTDSNKVLNFFYKYWKMFENTQSCVVMIPKTKLYPALSSRKLEDYTADKINIFHKPKESVNYDYFIKRTLDTIVELREDINIKHRENIDSEGLQCIDITNVIDRSNSRMNEEQINGTVTLEKCIELIKGLDPSKIDVAYSLIQALSKENIQEVEI